MPLMPYLLMRAAAPILFEAALSSESPVILLGTTTTKRTELTLEL